MNGNANMVISSRSTVMANRANGDCGGGLVAGYGTLLITSDSAVQNNIASVNGGGLCARDHGNLTVENGSSIVGNSCGSFGCGVLVGGDAKVVVKGHVTIGGFSRFLLDGSGENKCDKVCLQQRNTDRIEGKDTGGDVFAVAAKGSLLLHGPVYVAYNSAYGFVNGILAFWEAKVQIESGVEFTRPSPAFTVSGWDVTITDSAVLLLHEGVLSGGMPLSVCNASIRLGSTMCPPGTFTTSSGCTCCSSGMYDLSTESRPNATCSQCPLNALCNNGKVQPLLGHWRSSNRSVQIHRCPAYSTPCKGGEDTGNETCQAGYTGVQCGVCIRIWHDSASQVCQVPPTSQAADVVSGTGWYMPCVDHLHCACHLE